MAEDASALVYVCIASDRGRELFHSLKCEGVEVLLGLYFSTGQRAYELLSDWGWGGEVMAANCLSEVKRYSPSCTNLRATRHHLSWDHSVTCHPTQVNAPRLTAARKAGT